MHLSLAYHSLHRLQGLCYIFVSEMAGKDEARAQLPLVLGHEASRNQRHEPWAIAARSDIAAY